MLKYSDLVLLLKLFIELFQFLMLSNSHSAFGSAEYLCPLDGLVLSDGQNPAHT